MILLADDNDILRKTLTRQLADLGYVTHSVGNGLDAVECALKGDYRLILLDIKLPKLDGLQATKRIRKRCAAEGKPAIPIVALTGNAQREICLQSGMNDFLLKQVSLDDLRAITERWVPQSESNFIDQIAPALATILKQRRISLSFSYEELSELSDLPVAQLAVSHGS